MNITKRRITPIIIRDKIDSNGKIIKGQYEVVNGYQRIRTIKDIKTEGKIK